MNRNNQLDNECLRIVDERFHIDITIMARIMKHRFGYPESQTEMAITCALAFMLANEDIIIKSKEGFYENLRSNT